MVRSFVAYPEVVLMDATYKLNYKDIIYIYIYIYSPTPSSSLPEQPPYTHPIPAGRLGLHHQGAQTLCHPGALRLATLQSHDDQA